MKKNLFIAFEGIDGSGKSTQVKLLSENLEKSGHKVYTTSEPTDSTIGSIIRNIFRNRDEVDHRTIAALFAADRLDHLLNTTNGILRKMSEGYTVITDRYYLSSFAYQGAYVSLHWVMEANSLSTDLLRPDLTVYIDITPEISMKRLSKSRSSMELFETMEDLRIVRDKYLEAIEQLKFKDNIFVTEGNRPAEIIAADILKEISRISIAAKSN